MTTLQELANQVQELTGKLVKYEQVAQNQQTTIEDLKLRLAQLQKAPAGYPGWLKPVLRVPNRLRQRLNTTPPPVTAVPPAEPVTAAPAVPSYQIGYQPDLIPPVELMREEGMEVIEEWFRWAEEWSVILRIYGGLTRQSQVLEIGCGLGRIAYALRYILSPDGAYYGFEICRNKVDFLEQHFQPVYPNFHFSWADIYNTFYNPQGQQQAADYTFPYANDSFDIIYAASVFTHLMPEAAGHYFAEAARVLKPDGRCVFSCFLLDNYRPGQTRPFVFKDRLYNFEHFYDQYGADFAVGRLDNPEHVTAYRLSRLKEYTAKAGLELSQAPLPGLWSGSSANWVGAQDLIILKRAR
jgi:SAM-dependent methyltransferase